MLLEDQHFYTLIEQRQTEDGFVESTIKLNEQHPIYKGHFPQQAVVPGVCMMQMTKDIAESISGRNLFMRKCSNVKFMAIINPEINKDLRLQITVKKEDKDEITISNIAKFNETVALKLTVIYKKI